MNMDNVGEQQRRTVLVVDGNEKTAEALRLAWGKLQLAENLYLVMNYRDALKYLHECSKEKQANGHIKDDIAAVILDPMMTGEETGNILRAIRHNEACSNTPILFWTDTNSGYEVLKGKGVDAIEYKPRILSLIQKLDAECNLRVMPFHPYTGAVPPSVQVKHGKKNLTPHFSNSTGGNIQSTSVETS